MAARARKHEIQAHQREFPVGRHECRVTDTNVASVDANSVHEHEISCSCTRHACLRASQAGYGRPCPQT
eukprot:6447917-Alexandrium_andersonii.AAC.1